MATLADLARRLKRPAAAAGLPRLILMTDAVRLPDALPALRRLPAHEGAVIFRHYGIEGRERIGRLWRAECRRLGLRFLVAGDFALAVRLHADGVHLPEPLVRRLGGRGRLRRPWPGFLVTAAAHGPAAARRAKILGVDATLVSPVYATVSHPAARVLGVRGLARILGRGKGPVYALGGIDAVGAARLRNLPLAGFAGISGIV
ncbi:MAG: thiamine phosphate synthase [Magnetospirillum sp. WYHS-4]